MNQATVFCCGDIFIGDEDTKSILSREMKTIVQNADISVCNFEGPVKSAGAKIDKLGPNIQQARNSIDIVRESGFNMCILANNHIYDYGECGLISTIDQLDLKGIAHVGAGIDRKEAYKEKILEVNNLKIAFLAYADADFGSLSVDCGVRSGYAWLEDSQVIDDIESIKRKVDFVIVNVHAGVEECPLPLPEWKERYRNMCDAGADVVVGHHPHVPQGFESYKGSLIFYSLGNFYFDYEKYAMQKNSTFSIILSLKKGIEPNFEMICHHIQNGIVTLEHNTTLKNYIERMNAYSESVYLQLSCIQAHFLYKSRYRRLNQASLKSLVVTTAKHLITMGKYIKKRELLIRHNLGISSHRYTTIRALENQKNTYNSQHISEYKELCKIMDELANGE